MQDHFVGEFSTAAQAQANLLPLISPGPTMFDSKKLSLVDALLRQESDARAKTSVLPPPDLAAKLLDAYFSHLAPVLPILHRPSLDRNISDGLLEVDPSFRRLGTRASSFGQSSP